VYFLAEKQAMKKHKEAIESDPNFKLIDAVKLEMIHVFDRLRFSELNVDFLKDFIVEKGFIIYPRDLYAFFKECRIRYGNENDAFKAVYEVAEKQAARKQQTSSEDIIILSDFVKNELVKLRRDIDYRSMTKQFLMDYVVRKGFITRSTALNFAGVCAVKHQTMIHSSDYLIAEMKQDREETSDFALITSSFITAKHCDV
uniref:Chromosomal replication initiator protein DnaA n=1 Tax=Panagrolaimus sp. ES5 TaxID=591445 RepID=A0AC34FY73_9BILA